MLPLVHSALFMVWIRKAQYNYKNVLLPRKSILFAGGIKWHYQSKQHLP